MIFSRKNALAGLAASVTAAALPPALTAQELTVLRCGATLDDAVTPALYAQSSGLFKAAGLDVRVQPFTSGGAMTAAVAGGSLEVGKSSLMALIAGHARGVPFTLVAGAAQYSTDHPNVALVVLKDSPIKTAADLNGKTIATSALRSTDQISASAWIDQHGGDSSTVKIIELGGPAAVEALRAHRIEAANCVNPLLTDLVRAGTVRILGKSFDAIAKEFLIAAWFCTTDYVAHNRETVRKFVNVVRRATVYANGHHAETVPLLSAFSGIQPAAIMAMDRNTNATSLDPKLVQPTIDAAAKYQLIERPFPASEIIADL
jgi:NitT/TauT family transport system substrate-binding protein